MLRKPIVALCILAFCLLTVSCKKLDESTGPLTYQTLKFADSIPQDYGPLIGVTQNARYPEWFGLWFQKSDGTITEISVNVVKGKIDERVLTIPRK